MRLPALFVLGGAVALAGCSLQSTPKSKAPKTATARPTTVAVAPTHVVATVPSIGPAPKGSAYSKGKTYLVRGRYTLAESEFRKSISQGADVPASYHGLARAAEGRRDYATAYRAEKKAQHMQPTNVVYTYGAAYAALYAKDYHGSVAYASQYIKMRPKNPNGYHLRFLAFGGLLMHKQQVADAAMVVNLQPTASAWNDLGIAFSNDSRLPRAIAAFTKAIQLKPKVAAFYMNRAIVENLDKRPDLALRDLTTARTFARDARTRKTIDVAIKNLKTRSHR